MSNLYRLTKAQIVRRRQFLSKSQGRQRVDDRRVLSGIIFINRNGLRWCDAPAAYGPPKSLYNRWNRWRDMGVFARIMTGLAAEGADNKTISVDAAYLKAHRIASSLRLIIEGVDVWPASAVRRGNSKNLCHVASGYQSARNTARAA